jgi:hypothetical protein
VLTDRRAIVRALVVYESMFGNTETVALAIADGLRSTGVVVDAEEVGAAPPRPDDGVSLLIVGGPTHAFGLSRPGTRSSAEAQGGRPVVSETAGLRDWLAALPARSRPISAAAFDTHIDRPVPGSAAHAAQRRLRARGYRIATEAESFYVADVAGPLVEGELERARDWGASLGSVLAPT